MNPSIVTHTPLREAAMERLLKDVLGYPRDEVLMFDTPKHSDARGLPARPDGPRDPEGPLPRPEPSDADRFFERVFLPAHMQLNRMLRGLPFSEFAALSRDLQEQCRVDAHQAIALSLPRARAFAIVAMSCVLEDTLSNLATRPRAEVLTLLNDQTARQAFAERIAEACAAGYLGALLAPEAHA